MEFQAWVDGVLERRSWVLHGPTITIGRPVKFFTGAEGDRFVSPSNDTEVPEPVLQMDSGDAFVAKDPDIFFELGPHEDRYFRILQTQLSNFLRMVMAPESRPNVPRPTAGILLIALLRQTTRKLESANEKEREAEREAAQKNGVP